MDAKKIKYRGHSFTGFINFRIPFSAIEEWKEIIDETFEQDRSFGHICRERLFSQKNKNENDLNELNEIY